VSVMGLWGGGAAVGALILPGIGFLIGAGIGFLGALLVVAAASDLPQNLVFSQVLQMKESGEKVCMQYAELLYRYYRGYLPYDHLVDDVMSRKWNDRIVQIIPE